MIDASNYEYDLISGETPEEAYGQDSITVNINYLDFNPIYDGTGKQITESMLSNSAFNVLIPHRRAMLRVDTGNMWRQHMENNRILLLMMTETAISILTMPILVRAATAS